jgi:roadblock/LC7 domain-containing protein
MNDSGTPLPPPPPPSENVPAIPEEPRYPVSLAFDRDDHVANWRPLVNWLLAIPQWIVVYFLLIAERALTLLSFFFVLFTKKIPDPIFNFRVMAYRYQWRVSSYVLFMRDEYPPFSFEMTAIDDGTDPASFSIQPPGEMNRWLTLVKWLLAIPHYIVLFFLFIGVLFVLLVAFFAVLFTGRFPSGMRDYVIGVTRWSYRVIAYVSFMTDEYPPFSLA